MRREGDTLFLEGTVDMDSVPGLLDEACGLCREGVSRLDFGGVAALDSAAIALALEIQRRAGAPVRLQNVPPSVVNLAQLYSVADQLGLDG